MGVSTSHNSLGLHGLLQEIPSHSFYLEINTPNSASKRFCLCSIMKNYLIIKILLHVCVYSPYGPWPFLQFPNVYTDGRTPLTSDQPVARPLPTHRTTQTQNKRTQTSIPSVGFEPTIPAFERRKTVHALDRVATVISELYKYILYICSG
jgi:hypothetical protein